MTLLLDPLPRHHRLVARASLTEEALADKLLPRAVRRVAGGHAGGDTGDTGEAA